MQSNLFVGRGVISTRRFVVLQRKAKPTISQADAIARQNANAEAQRQSAERFRNSLIAKGLVRPSA